MKENGLATRIVLALNWLGGIILFRLLNWTSVYGQKNIPKESGTLFVASHFTMSDSWLIGTCFNLFDIFLNPDLIPYNLADEKNFALKKNKFPKISKFLEWVINLLNLLVGWWFRHSKCIPTNRQAGGINAHKRVVLILSNNESNILLFPESGRRRENEPIQISASVGKLICNSGAKNVIPIKLTGLPYKGGFIPVIFKKLEVIFGEPIIIPKLENPKNGDYKLITQLVIDTIENLSPGKIK